jgi:hypothetical protein
MAPPGHVLEHSALAPSNSAKSWEWLLPTIVLGLAAWFYFQ